MAYIALESLFFMKKILITAQRTILCGNYVILMNNIMYNCTFQPYSLDGMYFRMT